MGRDCISPHPRDIILACLFVKLYGQPMGNEARPWPDPEPISELVAYCAENHQANPRQSLSFSAKAWFPLLNPSPVQPSSMSPSRSLAKPSVTQASKRSLELLMRWIPVSSNGATGWAPSMAYAHQPMHALAGAGSVSQRPARKVRQSSRYKRATLASSHTIIFWTSITRSSFCVSSSQFESSRPLPGSPS
ncbi:hypothetical protein PG997_013458 [Apiospora hydei]|uniref:Uncharacterized protein n=1 Tax=Apiospora hydei TaxID=1337664 RepID=A0ABR1V8T2_9PEZI